LPHFPDPAKFWVERLSVDSAHALLTYAEDGSAALTVNQLGRGHVYYLGFYPNPAQARALLIHLAHGLAISMTAPSEPAPGLRHYRRGGYHLVINFTDQPLTATIGGQTVAIPPRDIRFWPAAGA
jgi:beta-galactosidase GanA